MRHLRLPLCAIGLALSCAAATGHAQTPALWLTTLRQDADRIVKAATADDFAWRRLAVELRSSWAVGVEQDVITVRPNLGVRSRHGRLADYYPAAGVAANSKGIVRQRICATLELVYQITLFGC